MKALVMFIAKVRGVVKEKFSWALSQTPAVFAPPNKNSWRRHWPNADWGLLKTQTLS